MDKINQKKGFTLAELLVVVAIIGVLVAVSIPIFTGQLEKSRDAVTVANLRSAYAEAQTAYMTETSSKTAQYFPASVTTNKLKAAGKSVDIVEVSGVVSKGKKANDFSELANSLPFSKEMAEDCKVMDNVPDTYTVIFEYDTTLGQLTYVTLKKTTTPDPNPDAGGGNEGNILTSDQMLDFSYYQIGNAQCLRICLEGYTAENQKYLDFSYSTMDGQYYVLQSNRNSFTNNDIHTIDEQTVAVLNSKLKGEYIPFTYGYGSQTTTSPYEYMYLESIKLEENGTIKLTLGRAYYR